MKIILKERLQPFFNNSCNCKILAGQSLLMKHQNSKIARQQLFSSSKCSALALKSYHASNSPIPSQLEQMLIKDYCTLLGATAISGFIQVKREEATEVATWHACLPSMSSFNQVFLNRCGPGKQINVGSLTT